MPAHVVGWLVLPNGFVHPLTDRPYSWRERLAYASEPLGRPEGSSPLPALPPAAPPLGLYPTRDDLVARAVVRAYLTSDDVGRNL